MNGSERGAAPTLAIFIIFIIVSTSLVLAHLQYLNKEEADKIQNYTANDITKSTSDSIKVELNKALNTSISAAMYDAGKLGKERKSVENRIIRYMNYKISKGWNYPNIVVEILPLNKKSTYFHWWPDGSLSVKVYLKSKLKHVKGPTAYGIVLRADINSRFMRIKHITDRIIKKAKKISPSEIINFEKELNENYECEGIDINLEIENKTLEVNVRDIYGPKEVIVKNN